mgnify:CR=1 FL=1
MKYSGVTQSALHWLREQIITGALPAGAKLTEARLADKLNISRPPLREALRRLESDNLAFSKPRRGSYVSYMSREDCLQIYRVREILECTALELVFTLGPEALSPVGEALESAADRECNFSAEKKDMMDLFDSMSLFHRELVRCSGNAWLQRCYRGLHFSLARYQVMYLLIPGSRAVSLQGHHDIMACLLQGDLQGAKKRMKAHLAINRDRLLERIGQACS